MPPWFAALVGQIESLSMDSRKDRERLWEVVYDNLPRRAMCAEVAAKLLERGGLDEVSAHGIASDAVRAAIDAIGMGSQ